MPSKNISAKTGGRQAAKARTRPPAKTGGARRGKASGGAAGRPLLYKTARAMQDKIDEYFTQRVGKFPVFNGGQPVFDKYGKAVFEEVPPTVAGLALFLGFADRTGLYEYKARAEFSDTVKKAVTRIERYAEEAVLTRDKPTGAIFWLKNHGWTAEEHTSLAVTEPLNEAELKQIMAERLDDPGANPADATE